MIELIAMEIAKEQYKDRLRKAEKTRLINQIRVSNICRRPVWLNLKQILSLILNLK